MQNKIKNAIYNNPYPFLITLIAAFAIIIAAIFIIHNIIESNDDSPKDLIGEAQREINIKIDKSLPYSNYLSGLEYTITRELKPGDPNSSYLKVEIDACGDQTITAEVRALTEQWVKDRGIDPNPYEIIIPELCDGEAS